MTALGKILHEIDLHAIEFESFGLCDDYVSVGWVKNIIKKHLSENKCSECSRRKFYQMGYEDGNKDNDGWIPVEKYGLPKEEGIYDLTIINGRGEYFSVRWEFLSGVHLSGHHHYVDGVHYWADNYQGNPINEFLSERVIAWRKKPEPYCSESSGV